VTRFVSEVPPLNGAYRIGIMVEDPVSEKPVSVRLFDEVFWVTSGELPGILSVPFTSEVRPA
jgi:hypothetical protein